MLVEIIIQSLFSVILSLSPIDFNTDTETLFTSPDSEAEISSFELPSFENILEIREEEEVVRVIDLPEVEIVATYTGDDKCSLPLNEDIPVIELPAVEIVASYPCKRKHETIVKDGEVIPVIQLDPVIITPES